MAVIAFWPEPYQSPFRLGVYVPHHSNLLILLIGVLLVDTNSIGPNAERRLIAARKDG
jgi:hypothetical protein